MKRHIIAVALVLAAVLPARAADDKPSVGPGLGEIMTLTQMRHLKLWFAGAQKNWDLAAYELDELQEGFDDAIKYFPTHDGLPVGQMVKDNTPGPTGDLKAAIEAKSPTKFAACLRASNRNLALWTFSSTTPARKSPLSTKGRWTSALRCSIFFKASVKCALAKSRSSD